MLYDMLKAKFGVREEYDALFAPGKEVMFGGSNNGSGVVFGGSCNNSGGIF